jgi:hypothetical protein
MPDLFIGLLLEHSIFVKFVKNDPILWILCGVTAFTECRLCTYLLIYLLAYLLSIWEESSWGANHFQLVKKFPVFYGTQRFIVSFARARYLSLFWASSIQFIHPHSNSCSVTVPYEILIGNTGDISTQQNNIYWVWNYNVFLQLQVITISETKEERVCEAAFFVSLDFG